MNNVCEVLRFRFKHCDAELTTMLEDAVPPVDLDRVGAFRAAVQKFTKKACVQGVI